MNNGATDRRVDGSSNRLPDFGHKGRAIKVQELVDKARSDVALANPVAFLIRAMGGEEIDGEKVSLRDRVEIAKFLAGRIMPQMQSAEMAGAGGNAVVAPLRIELYSSPGVAPSVVDEVRMGVTLPIKDVSPVEDIL